MKEFLKSLRFIFMPDYWLMNYPYDKAWDKYLNELMDKYDFTDVDSYTAKLGNDIIWITNHPYASFRFSSKINYLGLSVRPSRLTIYRAQKKLMDDIIKNLPGQ